MSSSILFQIRNIFKKYCFQVLPSAVLYKLSLLKLCMGQNFYNFALKVINIIYFVWCIVNKMTLFTFKQL